MAKHAFGSCVVGPVLEGPSCRNFWLDVKWIRRTTGGRIIVAFFFNSGFSLQNKWFFLLESEAV